MSSTRQLPQLPGSIAPLAVALVAFVFARVWDSPSYDSVRPAPVSFGHDPTAPPGRVDALLTQDPLDSVYLPSARKGAPTPPDDLREFLRLDAGSETRPPVRVLLLLVRGGAWPEDRKWRIRERYAVVTALLHAGFAPEQGRHLHFFRSATNPDLVVPYEKFQRATPTAESGDEVERLASLWIDEHAIARDPPDAVRTLCDELAFFQPQVDLHVVGPSNSGDLERWLAGSSRASTTPLPPEPLRLWSPHATVAAKYLAGDSVDERRLTLTRTIGTDDVLADLLMLELRERLPELMDFEPLEAPSPADHQGASSSSEAVAMAALERARDDALDTTPGLRLAARVLRGLRFIPPSRDVRIALIVEKDSLYGRRWCDNLFEARNRLAARDDAFLRVEFEEYAYLSVIDGQELGPSGATQYEALREWGTSQVDFIRRIGTALETRGGVDAIGILGSDTYDVLLILGALRSRFPEAVFFTTDLDIQLLDPRHIAATRNLIVASHRGIIEVESCRSLEIPIGSVPFRDAYQLSVHETVQRLASSGVAQAWEHSARLPRLYEVGERGPVELNVEGMLPRPGRSERPRPFLVRLGRELGLGAARAETPEVAPLVAGTTPDAGLGAEIRAPQGTRSGAGDAHAQAGTGERARAPDPRWLLITIAGFLLLFLAVGHRPGTHSGLTLVQRLLRFARGGILALLVFVVLLLVLVWQDEAAQLAPAEPLAWLGGVSVWPSILLRMGAVGLCLVAIASIRAGSLVVCQELIEELEPDEERKWRGLSVPWPWVFSLSLSDQDRRRKVVEVFGALRKLASRWSLLVPRLVVYVLFGFVCLAPLFMLARMASPARGEFTYLWERISIFSLVVCFLALFFYVLEIVYVGQRLALRLTDDQATLPEAAVKDEAVRTGLPEALAETRMRLRLVQRLTRFTDRIILWPAAVVALMILSRASLFDRWGWPMPLLVTQSFFFTLLALCAWNNHRLARRYRGASLARVGNAILRSLDTVRIAQLSALAQEIRDLRGGAFSPLLQQPIVQSLVWPLVALLVSLSAERIPLSPLLAGSG